MARHKRRVCKPEEVEAVLDYWDSQGWTLISICLDPGGVVDDQMPSGRTITSRGPAYHLFFKDRL